MKKLTIIFTALTLFLATTAFADPIDVTREVQTAFAKNFAGATNVTWDESDDFYFASFELEGKKIKAAFNVQGELLGLSRKLTLSEIPLNVSQALKTDFPAYKIQETITEIVFEGQTFYYASAIGEKKEFIPEMFFRWPDIHREAHEKIALFGFKWRTMEGPALWQGFSLLLIRVVKYYLMTVDIA